MKLRNLFLGLFATTALIVSCDPKDEDLGAPSITLNETELVFAQEGETKTITVKATREWKVELGGVDWLAFSPESGKASLDGQTVQVTALPNNGVNREASIKITIGMVSKSLTVTQAGTQGSPEDLIIYSNNFDKTVATQTYGSGSSWPFLDQFDGWQNATGTGLEGHEYSYKGASVRANSFSNDKYSDYNGSGNNNVFFGANSYFSVNKIALGGATNIEISFGGSKYIQGANNLFSPAEFHVWLSSDGQKWVDASYTFTGTVEGKWNIAKGTYNVAGVEKLYVCFQPDLASAYRIDDLNIVVTDVQGETVDFANGVTKDFGAGTSTDPTDPTDPSDPIGEATATIKEVLAATGALAQNTIIEGVVISNMDLNNLTSKKGLYVQDATAGLQFYLAENHEYKFGDKLKIDLSGVTLGSYNDAKQISGLALTKIKKVSSGNAVDPKTVTIEDFLANKYEAQYIAIENVQVVSADLSKTFVMDASHTSITIEDATGKTFVVFSSKYSNFGAEKVPQGKGTIKGISSISEGTMQIIFAQASDYEGLTGTRFDGTEPQEPQDPQEPEDPQEPDGDYEPGVTWTLGTNSYDATKDQTATVNGVAVSNLLKLGTSKATGKATIDIPAGTVKLGFYCVGWKGKNASTVKFSGEGMTAVEITPQANVGATGNAPYTLTITTDDYYYVEVPSGVTTVDVETISESQGRVLLIGMKAFSE